MKRLIPLVFCLSVMSLNVHAGNLSESDNFCVFNNYKGKYEDIIASVSDGSKFIAYVKPYGLNIGTRKWKEVTEDRATSVIYSKTSNGHTYNNLCTLYNFRSRYNDENDLEIICITVVDMGKGRYGLPVGTGDRSIVSIENNGLIEKAKTTCVDYNGEEIDPAYDDNNR